MIPEPMLIKHQAINVSEVAAGVVIDFERGCSAKPRGFAGTKLSTGKIEKYKMRNPYSPLQC